MKRAFFPKLLILISLLIFIVYYFLAYPCLIVYSVGVIFLILRKDINIKSKLIWILLPPISAIPLALILIYSYFGIGYLSSPTEIFIFQENFSGPVEIIESECGVDLKKVDGKIEYNIPKNGVLLIKKEISNNFINDKYYEQKIDSLYEIRTTGKEVKGFGTGSRNNNQISYISFYVKDSHIIRTKKEYALEYREFREHVDSILNMCNE